MRKTQLLNAQIIPQYYLLDDKLLLACVIIC